MVIPKRYTKHTGHCSCLLCVLSTNKEDYVTLASVDIVVLKEEDLVDAIFLQRAELDEQANRARKRLLNDQVLFASHL